MEQVGKGTTHSCGWIHVGMGGNIGDWETEQPGLEPIQLTDILV